MASRTSLQTVLALAASQDAVPFRARQGHLHSTWARTYQSRPELYIQPQSLDEIEKVIRLAQRFGRRVTVVGSRHSPSDLTCTSSWLVNLDNFNKIVAAKWDSELSTVTMQSGIRLYELSEQLDRYGLAMPNLGSINEQSIAGAISTGTHGSSLQHGLLSDDILSLKITLSSGETTYCSPDEKPDLFRAAVLSVGALGIITEVTFRAVPAFNLRWKQVVDSDERMLADWSTTLWTRAEFVRVWWFPYTRRAVVWTADKTDEQLRDPPASYYDGWLGYAVYHNLLRLAQRVPQILPWVEWFVFGMQYGFRNGSATTAVQTSRRALLMNCLYLQYVNEWAIPLERGPEALRKLSTWLNNLQETDSHYLHHDFPGSARDLFVHAPVEVRVTNTSLKDGRVHQPRPHLDPTVADGPTLYLNATLYRPYGLDPPCLGRYYEAFERLMEDLGGRPHWAKNFRISGTDLQRLYPGTMDEWRKIRNECDPEGMFLGPWHRRNLFPEGEERFELEEL